MASQSDLRECDHQSLTYEPSPHAHEAGYRGYTPEQLLTAAGKNKKTSTPEDLSIFPAPLVLPEDDLAIDPRYPSQSVRSWARAEHRNRLTPTRRTIYVAASPIIHKDVSFLGGWLFPPTQHYLVKRAKAIKTPMVPSPSRPQTEDVIEYLSAFYHGMTVKKLPLELAYAAWDSDSKKGPGSKAKAQAPAPIALNTANESIRISTRLSPDGLFGGQLGLNDLIEVGIAILPSDAYALLMLIDHDMFEDEDDDFCCGRAYGGSRVAVVSSARYNPFLDIKQAVQREHAWPLSHCERYVRDLDVGPRASKKVKKEKVKKDGRELPPGALQAAVDAYRRIPASSWCDHSHLSNVWLSGFVRTASHELGHCFGMDHCVYYACIMQGTASMVEDVRQPPYLCPVDLAKLCKALGLTDKDVDDRYRALQAYCSKFGHAFAGFEGWLSKRAELDL